MRYKKTPHAIFVILFATKLSPPSGIKKSAVGVDILRAAHLCVSHHLWRGEYRAANAVMSRLSGSILYIDASGVNTDVWRFT